MATNSNAEQGMIRVDMPAMKPGFEPEDFAIWRTSNGDAAEWRVVTDMTAAGPTAIAQVSTDSIRDHFPLAAYKPVPAKNVEVVARFKPILEKSPDLARRTLIQSSAALAAASLVTTPALAQSPTATGPKSMTYTIKALPFDPKSIKGFSEKILTSHYENNYSARLNGSMP